MPMSNNRATRSLGPSRRDLLASLLAMGLLPSRTGIAQPTVQDSLPIQIRTLNHASFPCPNAKATIEWYGRVLGMPLYAFQDYGSGQHILKLGDEHFPAYIAISDQDPKTAGRPVLPHFCFGIENYSVDRIMRALSQMPAFAQSVLREGTTINGVNFTDLNKFPLRVNPVNACGGGGFWGELCEVSATVVRDPHWAPPVLVRTFNHVRMVVPDVQRTVAWYTKLTDMTPQVFHEAGGPRTILRVGAGPQFVMLVEGAGPDAFRPHLGFGVPGFDPGHVMRRLHDHGVMARMTLRNGVTPEILVDGPDGVEIQLQDVSYSGGGGKLGNIDTTSR